MIHSEKCDHFEKFTEKLSFLFNLVIGIGEGPDLRHGAVIQRFQTFKDKKKNI